MNPVTIFLIGEHEATVTVRPHASVHRVTLTVADPALLSHSGLTPEQARALAQALIDATEEAER